MGFPDGRADTRRGYDQVAEDYAVLIPNLDTESALDRAMLEQFAARCRKSQRRRIADVGCGTGRVTAYLADSGLDVVGTDLSPGMVAVARRSHPHLSFRVQPMEEMEEGDASLDGALAWYSLIHTAPDRLHSVFTEFHRVLRPGGWFLTGFQAGDGERVDRSTAYGHSVDMTNYLHSPKHLTQLLEATGFLIEAQLQRAPQKNERTPQTVLLARREPAGPVQV